MDKGCLVGDFQVGAIGKTDLAHGMAAALGDAQLIQRTVAFDVADQHRHAIGHGQRHLVQARSVAVEIAGRHRTRVVSHGRHSDRSKSSRSTMPSPVALTCSPVAATNSSRLPCASRDVASRRYFSQRTWAKGVNKPRVMTMPTRLVSMMKVLRPHVSCDWN